MKLSVIIAICYLIYSVIIFIEVDICEGDLDSFANTPKSIAYLNGWNLFGGVLAWIFSLVFNPIHYLLLLLRWLFTYKKEE